MNPTRTTHILHLEDDPVESEYVVAALAADDFRCTITRVETRAAFEQALAGDDVDLILADLTLPDFSGDEALELARTTRPDVPFVFYSGSIGEDAAVESLRSGATDYVFKDRAGRLPSAIARALSDAEAQRERERERAEARRHAEQVIRFQQAQLTLLQSEFTDAETSFRTINEVAARALGVERSAIWLYETDSDDILCVDAYAPADDSHGGGIRVPGAGPQFAAVVARDSVLAVRDVVVDPRTTPLHDVLDGLGIRSCLATPILLDGRVAGVASQSNMSCERSWTLEEVGFAVSVGEAAARALASAERSQLEEQLNQARRLEAVGRLAGGIAHDFNNMLAAVRGWCDVLLSDLAADDPSIEPVMHIRDASDRAASLVRQLLALSRQQVMRPSVVDLNDVVSGLEPMIRPLLGPGVELTIGLGHAPVFVRIDRSQFEQVILNLAVNANDAMPDGGRLRIAADVDDPVETAPQTAALTVHDTGMGIDADDRDRIFDPFFTTKETGKGTGLGLSIVHGIVSQSDGTIDVDSAVGVGTTFTITLPCVEPEVSATPAPAPAATLPESAGSGTVLLVEDDDLVRNVTRRIVVRHGYKVIEASSAEEALVVARSHGGKIDLLLSDVVMRNMDGVELARTLRAEHPTLRVLLMSGHTDHPAITDPAARRDLDAAFVHKPCSAATLIETMRAVLA